MRVLIADKTAPESIAALDALGCSVQADPSLADQALAEAIGSFDPEIIVVRSTKVTGEHIAAGQSLALVVRAGAGVNTIDVSAACKRGVYVANCPGKNAAAVAELTIGHLINLDRRISDNVVALREHRWAKKEFSGGYGLRGRTLALLGMGKIGGQVAKAAKALGMNVRAWSRSLTERRAKDLGVEYAPSPLDACRDADALTIHLGLTDDTRGLVSSDLLMALRAGALVVNTSRGEVLDSAALEAAITTRGLRAGLDVFADEPKASDKVFSSTIADNPSVYGTHHIGASTAQAAEAVGDEVVNIISTFKQTAVVQNCVNLADETPATHLLVVRHADEVGVLAGILDSLREANVNIQEMDNKVFRGAAAATAHLHLDSGPSDNLLGEIRQGKGVFNATLVRLKA